MIHEIGEGAGEMWRYLNEQPSATPVQINKSLKPSENLFFMAIGWHGRINLLLREREKA